MTRFTLAWALGGAVLALAGAAPVGAPAAEVILTRVDGRTVAGSLAALSDTDVSLSLSSPDEDLGTIGAQVEIAWDELASATFLAGSPPTPAGASAPPVTFHFAGGGSLRAELVSAAPDAVVVHNPQTGELVVPFAQLEAVVFARTEGPVEPARQLLDAARADRATGQDVLVAADGTEAKAVRGAVTQLGPEASEFLFNNRARRIETARIFGIVFAGGANLAAAAPMLLCLQDGNAIPGKPAAAGFAGETLRFETSFGRTLEVPLAALARIEVRNPRIVSLAALEPAAVKTGGIVHEPWPWRRDRSVGNTPLAMAGQHFERGLGVHAHTALTYTLDGAFETFAATVGIDDAVRPRGAVEFTVALDGKTAWTSGVLTGADRPRNVVVPVAGARTLELRVDFGPGGDVSDWADWADARLIKAATDRQKTP